jgi:phosphopantetheinyl transferase (holo-ACP synthase)
MSLGSCQSSINSGVEQTPVTTFGSTEGLGNVPAVWGATAVSAGARRSLAHFLLGKLARVDSSFHWVDDGSLFLGRSPLGAPFLLLGNQSGPSISFSRCDGNLWSAVSRHRVGIDVAAAHEFAGDYPFDRAFTSAELEQTLSLNAGDAGMAAAMAWSAKEAVVKAMGTGFNHYDPKEVELGPIHSISKTCLRSTVYLEKPIPVWFRQVGDTWLAVAVM